MRWCWVDDLNSGRQRIMNWKGPVTHSNHRNVMSVISVTHFTSCWQEAGLLAGLCHFIMFHIAQIVMCHKPDELLLLFISSSVGGLSLIPSQHMSYATPNTKHSAWQEMISGHFSFYKIIRQKILFNFQRMKIRLRKSFFFINDLLHLSSF